MNLKANTYYKVSRTNHDDTIYIIYISHKGWKIAFSKYNNDVWEQHNANRYQPFNDIQRTLRVYKYKVEEISYTDILLELI